MKLNQNLTMDDFQVVSYVKKQLNCPCPEDKMLLIEYGGMEPEHYDGVSEITCTQCKKRVGRWSGKTLLEGEVEKRFGKV